MKLLKFTFVSILFILLFSERIDAQNKNTFSEEQISMLDSIDKKPSGKIYFYNGIELSERDFIEKGMNGELNQGMGTGWEGKNAIIRYGERYRYGVIFWISNKKENENEISE